MKRLLIALLLLTGCNQDVSKEKTEKDYTAQKFVLLKSTCEKIAIDFKSKISFYFEKSLGYVCVVKSQQIHFVEEEIETLNWYYKLKGK